MPEILDPDVVYSLRRIADLVEAFIREHRERLHELGKDIDEIPTAVRIDASKIAADLLAAIAKLGDHRPALAALNRIVSRARQALWAEAGAESEAGRAVRRALDVLRAAIGDELGEPWQPDPEIMLERRDPSAIVVGGSRLSRAHLARLWKWVKWAWPLLPAGVVELAHRLLGR